MYIKFFIFYFFIFFIFLFLRNKLKTFAVIIKHLNWFSSIDNKCIISKHQRVVIPIDKINFFWDIYFIAISV